MQVGESAGPECKAVLQEITNLVEQRLESDQKELKKLFNASKVEKTCLSFFTFRVLFRYCCKFCQKRFCKFMTYFDIVAIFILTTLLHFLTDVKFYWFCSKLELFSDRIMEFNDDLICITAIGRWQLLVFSGRCSSHSGT